VNWQGYAHLPLPDVRPLTQTLLLAMFAFSGFEVIAVPGAEIVDARRTVPLGLLAGTGITILIYVLIQTVAVGTFPGLANSQTPLASAARTFLGPKGGLILGAGAICSTIGTLTSLLLVAPRILFAMALNLQMPASFSRIHLRYRTPHVAILFCTLLTIALTLSGSFTRLATLSAIARIVTYIGSAAALLILRKKVPEAKFRVPGGWFIPLLTILLCVFLLTAATRAYWIAGGIAVAFGLLLYAWSLRRVSHPVSN
jgi:basic amino acid/polyamine antiporter, APA family